VSPILELGCATLAFRTIEKPHIAQNIHDPLIRRGGRIVGTDFKQDQGVDISGDIYDPRTEAELRSVNAKTVLCCNIFEHLADRKAFAAVCDRLVPPGGRIIVTVPFSYPFHPDPIDTYFRPSPQEIAKLFPGYEIEAAQIIGSTTYGRELLQERNPFLHAIKQLVRIVTLRGGFLATRGRAHRWLWLLSPYKISAVILRKPMA
jgi:hypothetical protein